MTRKVLDWDAIEREYRTGHWSIRALGTKHDVSAAAISKRAKRDGWVQDASAEVRERTRAALLIQPKDGKAEPEVNTVNAKVNTKVNTPTQADIEVAVQTNVQVINRHRKDIGQGQRIVGLMMAELIEGIQHREEVEKVIHEETADDASLQRRNRMLKMVSLPARAGTVRDLSTAMKNLVLLERQAYNLDDHGSEDSIEDRLMRLAGEQHD